MIDRIKELFSGKHPATPINSASDTPKRENEFVLLDPVKDPNRARLAAFKTPGVVKGVVPIDSLNGTTYIDFDHRDKDGNPTVTFIPNTGSFHNL